MPSCCCVPRCKGNYPTGPKVSVYSFPSDETRQAWLSVLRRENFVPTKYSKVCELHFEPDQIVREASAFDPRTGRTLTAPLSIPRLRKGAVPTLLMPPLGTIYKPRFGPVPSKNRKEKDQPEEETEVTDETEETNESELAKLLQIDSETESQTVDEPSNDIKEEPFDLLGVPSPLVIGKIVGAENLTSSPPSSPHSTSSPSPINSPSSAENASSVADPDSSTNVIETPVSKKTSKRKNDTKPNASDSSTPVFRAKKRRIAEIASTSKSPPVGTAKKSVGTAKKSVGTAKKSIGSSKKSASPSIPPTDDAENATREMFQFLVNGSENRTGERPGDLFDVFADFIADKLREMDWDKCAYALRAILDIVFKSGETKPSSEVDKNVSSPGCSSSHE